MTTFATIILITSTNNMNYIKEILYEKGLSVNELAVKLGISRQALSRQIQGKMLVETAERIAIALEVPLWRLFASTQSLESVGEDKLVAFFHHKGHSKIPTTMEEMMTILKEWREDEFHKICHRHDIQHMRERFASNDAIQRLIDALCEELEGCHCSNPQQ